MVYVCLYVHIRTYIREENIWKIKVSLFSMIKCSFFGSFGKSRVDN